MSITCEKCGADISFDGEDHPNCETVERLRDALDHIQRVAHAGMQPTRRLDWISLRARVALRGDKWQPGYVDEPGNTRKELVEKNIALREHLSKWKSWADWANARYREATGKDLPQEETGA